LFQYSLQLAAKQIETKKSNGFLGQENHQIFFYSFSDLERTENIDGENKLGIVLCVASCVTKNFSKTPQLAVIEMRKF